MCCLQGVLKPGEAIEVVLQILVVGGSEGTADLLTTAQVRTGLLLPCISVLLTCV